MIICGLKLTHDGAVALLDNGRLAFSVEMEKLHNNPRYTAIDDTILIENILEDQGYRVEAVDLFAIDGWGGYDQDALAIQPRLTIGTNDQNLLYVENKGVPYQLSIAQYHERSLQRSVLEEWRGSDLRIGPHRLPYTTYLHVTGHIMSAYCSSPFASKGESAYVLVWDGGMYPRLYHVNAATRSIDNLGPIFLLIGNIYSIFSQHFGPFKVKGGFAKDTLSVAGKVMAYIALGKIRPELFQIFDELYRGHYEAPMGFANVFANLFKERVAHLNYPDEDILHSFHAFLEQLLVDKLSKKVARFGHPTTNLCLVGGCALNIKWNRAIRNAGVFSAVYVPPFPNDAGSAIGAACTAMAIHTGQWAMDWNVYSGPNIAANAPAEGWDAGDCDMASLAALLHGSGEPVVFLHGRAELGPRALGHRSILASPASPYMKDLLNHVKKRESYRPISPICLESQAPNIFEPGSPDPYMLFDHYVRYGWHDKIPAICHLDGTARLQTVNAESEPLITELLHAFYSLSGIPLLCNTSANLLGKGFFPDVRSATEWGQVNYVWCQGQLYERQNKINFQVQAALATAIR